MERGKPWTRGHSTELSRGPQAESFKIKGILNFESGQVLLIIVLVMVVALTVGLSIASRSVTHLRTSTEEENSQRAFSAAEAGIEEALVIGCIAPTPGGLSPTPQGGSCTPIAKNFTSNNSSFSTKIAAVNGAAFLLAGGNPVEKDNGIDLWLVEHSQNGTLNYSSGWQQLSGNKKLTIYWGSSSDRCHEDALNTMAAIEIVVVSGTYPNLLVSKRYVADPCTERKGRNWFDSPDTTGLDTLLGRSFAYRKQIDIANTSKGILVRIIPLYASTPIGIKGCELAVSEGSPSCTVLPSQGKRIESTGISGNTARKIIVYQGYPQLPAEFFPYILFVPKTQ